MDLSGKNDAWKNYLEQAKEAFSLGEIDRARALFLKAADITNEITMETRNPEIKQEYYRVTKRIMDFVKNSCVKKVETSEKNHEEENLNIISVEYNEEITLDKALKKLNDLIGLENVKNTINDWVRQFQVAQVRKELYNLKNPEISYHMVFMGNPGTGKTTVARIISQIYFALGILPKGHLVEVDRSKLVAGYVGQTAILTQNVIQKAIGGVLFIDEAYSLFESGSNDFGQEAVNTLVKAMEDHRSDLAVIVAGYGEKMNEFIDSNQGLKSRFKTFVDFEDYKPEELMDIFIKFCQESDYVLSNTAKETLSYYFQKLYLTRGNNFGNGRDVRNLFENTLNNFAKRIEDKMKTSTKIFFN